MFQTSTLGRHSSFDRAILAVPVPVASPTISDCAPRSSAKARLTRTLNRASLLRRRPQARSNIVRFGPMADKRGRNWIVRLVPIADIDDGSLAMLGCCARQSDRGNILWSVLWLLVPLNGSIQQKDTASFNRKAVARTCSCISLRLSAQA